MAGGLALGALLSSTAVPTILRAQEAAPPAGEPFSFDILTEMMRTRSAGEDPVAPPLSDFLASLDYDKYNLIQFWPKRARWSEAESSWRVLPFHIGWLFKEPVHIHEIVDGRATEMTFTTADFEYRGKLKDEVPADFTLPGVAGFKLNHPVNRADLYDEVISFVGASYFRVLGQGENNGGIRDTSAQHLIFLTVLDQNGNGVDGAVVRNLVGEKGDVTTGAKGPGKAEITMYYEPFKLAVVADGSGPVTSQVSNQMGLIFPHLPDIVGKLGDVNYEYGACPTIDIKCEWPLSAIHFSYEITFQKVK